MIVRLLRALVASVLVVVASPLYAATDYTDTWWNPSEAGWGVNLTQQADVIYATFYVYGQDRKATWYAAAMFRDGGDERFIGDLYQFTGTWLGAPVWQGNDPGVKVGTATFTAGSANVGTLAYNVGGASVTKLIERIVLAAVNVAGSYRGAAAGTRSGCAAGGNLHFTDAVDIEIQHSPTTREIRISQYSVTSGLLICRMEGTTVQFGKLLLVDNASYVCPDAAWNSPARIYNLRPTPTGFEAQWFSNASGGCTESGDLSGVRYR
jgi:hypothetical protein